MSFIEGSSDGTLNDTSPVTIVASPSGTTRRIIKSINIQNRDTASVLLTVRYVNGASTRQIWKGTLLVNETIVFGEEDFLVLDATNKSITAVLGTAVTSAQPDYVASWGDAT